MSDDFVTSTLHSSVLPFQISLELSPVNQQTSEINSREYSKSVQVYKVFCHRGMKTTIINHFQLDCVLIKGLVRLAIVYTPAATTESISLWGALPPLDIIRRYWSIIMTSN